MASRYGKPVELWDEVLFYLKGLPAGAYLSLWLIKDFLDGCRGNEFSEEEFLSVIERLEKTYNVKFANGSLGESIKSSTTSELMLRTEKKLSRQKEGFTYSSKLEELELNH